MGLYYLGYLIVLFTYIVNNPHSTKENHQHFHPHWWFFLYKKWYNRGIKRNKLNMPTRTSANRSRILKSAFSKVNNFLKSTRKSSSSARASILRANRK